MNWLTYFSRSLALLPVVIAGIQQIHADKKGADKKQIALEYLGLATVVAGAEMTADQSAQSQAASAIGPLIDSTVAQFHANDAPGFGANSKPAK